MIWGNTLRTFGAGLAIAFLLSTPSAQAKRPSKGCVYAVLAAAAIAVGYLSPVIYHEVSGQVTGEIHVGHGIHLDWERVLGSFSAEEQAIFRNPQGHETEIVQIINARLKNSWNEEMGTHVYWFPNTRYVSEFLPATPEPVGVCRHQARIMHAVLTRIGIKAEIWTGFDDTIPGWHAWVELPDAGIVADPNLAEPMTIEAFHGSMQNIHKLSFRERFVSNVLY